ncbi:hypothetical protein [Sphingomonas natans]|nr:hypothetical protein [Sphingomonas sp. BIUV-7]
MDDHERLRAIVGRLEAFLEASSPPVDMAFPRLRWELIRELSVHSAVERMKLPGLSKTHAAVYHGLDTELDAAVSAHMIEWSVSSIQDGWHAYRASARALLARLLRRMRYEEQALFPLIA